jgi:uncharacterized protein YecA (UPF0149 family)
MDSVHLSFETTLGDFEADFPTSERVRSVKRSVMEGVRLDPNDANAFVINLDETELEDEKVLADLGLEPNTWLVLERRKQRV